VPFVKFSRDKRGYTNVFLVHPVAGRRGRSRHRILYWFRTPPHVKVGREPFDDSAVQALAAQNTGIAFDWKRLRSTTIPLAPPEDWRERRQAKRAARRERESMEQGADAMPAGQPQDATPAAEDGSSLASAPAIAASAEGSSNELDPTTTTARGTPRTRRRRRRRRRRRASAAHAERTGLSNGSIQAPPVQTPPVSTDREDS
jgi:hypothetical protein